MHTPFLLLFFFYLNFTFCWSLAFLALFLPVQTILLCSCFHLKSHVIFSVWVQTGVLCSPVLAFCGACWPSCTPERAIPLGREETVKISQVSCTPLPPEAVPSVILKSRYLKRLKIDFLKSRIIILLSILLTSLKLQSQNQYCRPCSKDVIIGNIQNKVSYCWELQLQKYYRMWTSLLGKHFLLEYYEKWCSDAPRRKAEMIISIYLLY